MGPMYYLLINRFNNPYFITIGTFYQIISDFLYIIYTYAIQNNRHSQIFCLQKNRISKKYPPLPTKRRKRGVTLL